MHVPYSVPALLALALAGSPAAIFAGPDHAHEEDAVHNDAEPHGHDHDEDTPATQAFYGDAEDPEIIEVAEGDHGHPHDNNHGHPHDHEDSFDAMDHEHDHEDDDGHGHDDDDDHDEAGNGQ